VRRLALLLSALALLAPLAACGSSHHAGTYSGRLYSVSQVRKAFAQLGFALRRRAGQPPGLVVLQLRTRLPAGSRRTGRETGSVVVATRRVTADTSISLPGRVTRWANVTAYYKPYVLDEVRGAMSALRWGTLAHAKPARHLIVLGDSIGGVRLGESRKKVEQALGRGKQNGRGVVSYFGGQLLVDYEFHDRIYRWVSYVETRWSGFHTGSGVHVGSNRQALRRIYATCDSKTECHVLEGPWPDALATGFTMRNGKVAEIEIGPS
jgi:hypothetical protein